MAVVIAQALIASGGEVSAGACDEMVRAWAGWAQTAPDVGTQTRAVLPASQRAASQEGREVTGRDAVAAAEEIHVRAGRSGGNGSLMRTAPVALAFSDRSPAATYDAAVLIITLTHFDPEAGEACGLWTVAIRHAVLTGELDLRTGLGLLPRDRAEVWEDHFARAEAGRPSDFHHNGWVVEALQGAWSAITTTAGEDIQGPEHLCSALEAAVRGGVDTDTVAAIAGSLLGAAYGVAAIPNHWLRVLHGWPGLRGRDLIGLGASLAARRSLAGKWPATHRKDYSNWAGAHDSGTVPHPDDPGVLLGPVGALDAGDYDTVVSLCRVGSHQAAVPSPQWYTEFWLVDGAKPYPEYTVQDAAETVLSFRKQGKRVLLHCVRMESRTPTVAAFYGALVTGSSRPAALDRVRTVLPSANPNGHF